MKTRFLFLLAFFASSATQASTINLKVNGLVCSFCAQGLEKTFKALPQTTAVYVSLEKHLVMISVKPDQDISNDQLKKAITSSGFTLVDIQRNDTPLPSSK